MLTPHHQDVKDQTTLRFLYIQESVISPMLSFLTNLKTVLFGLRKKTNHSIHLHSPMFANIERFFPSQGSYVAFPRAITSLIFMSPHCDSLVNKPSDKSIFPVRCDKNSSAALFMQFRSQGSTYVVIVFHKGPRQQSIYFTLMDLLRKWHNLLLCLSFCKRVA